MRISHTLSSTTRVQRGLRAGLLLLMFTAMSVVLVWSAQSASADTNCTPGGCGKTYNNNPDTNCWWYDSLGYEIRRACYRGVWSDTSATGGTLNMYEWGEFQQLSCLGSPPYQACQGLWTYFNSPLYFYWYDYVSTNGVHYYNDPLGIKRPVRGNSTHNNENYIRTYWWATSDDGSYP